MVGRELLASSVHHYYAAVSNLRARMDFTLEQPCVYLLASKPNGTLYVGVTSNLIQRVYQHRTAVVEGFTRAYGVKTLVWYEQHATMESAISREKAIKKWRRSWKIGLISAMNPEWRDLYEGLV